MPMHVSMPEAFSGVEPRADDPHSASINSGRGFFSARVLGSEHRRVVFVCFFFGVLFLRDVRTWNRRFPFKPTTCAFLGTSWG